MIFKKREKITPNRYKSTTQKIKAQNEFIENLKLALLGLFFLAGSVGLFFNSTVPPKKFAKIERNERIIREILIENQIPTNKELMADLINILNKHPAEEIQKMATFANNLLKETNEVQKYLKEGNLIKTAGFFSRIDKEIKILNDFGFKNIATKLSDELHNMRKLFS